MAADTWYWIGPAGPFPYEEGVSKCNDVNDYSGIAVAGQFDLKALFSTGPVTVSTIELTDLTASRLVATDASSALASVANLTSWIAGAGGITVTDDGDGTVTITAGGFGAAVGKTISSGAIALTAGQRHIQLTGEGDVADTLTSITPGDEIVLRGKTGLAYTITVSDAGTLKLQASFSIDSEYDTLTLMNIGSDNWVELSRANNA